MTGRRDTIDMLVEDKVLKELGHVDDCSDIHLIPCMEARGFMAVN